MFVGGFVRFDVWVGKRALPIHFPCPFLNQHSTDYYTRG